ncbi:zinc-dependent alcohol dehydrogenase family protein [Enterobacteriaceae bacterium H11S18]|uniref:zinc-dependent alcohol dehydrogenase family protein n=1 Tax=Dryocola clanedunensis TaxID=2925396 RepID=UPI0022F10EC7|nr:zinc-dependent alcohol dehydrogenase family protein [Dryocola clanedunensis]MCT4713354.1 zinc-dependent alcohol dehydrogenase family protein [Dryocola clanedunensis]
MENAALWFRQFGHPEDVLTLEHRTLAARKPGMLRVKMRYSPVNPSDLIPVTGAYRHRVVPPKVAGYEGVGVVVEADNPALIGQRVLPLRGEGTWQQFVDCEPALAVPVPDETPDLLAARGYINPLAAYVMLKKWPVRGKTVLLTAANSSCAGLLAQWARGQGAQRIFGVHRSQNQIAALEQNGVTPVSINEVSVLKETARHADVIFDAVGGELATTLLQHLSVNAAFISYGLLSGQPYQLKTSLIGPQRFHLRDTLAVTAPEIWQRWFVELWSLLAKSQLPEVSLFALGEWREALREFAAPGRRRKPVLVF